VQRRELELTMAQVRNWFAESCVPFPSQVLDDVRQGDLSLLGADYCSSGICKVPMSCELL
jgi:hypothetical protein